VGLRLLVYWNFGFESCLGHGILSLVNATGRSLVQRGSTERGMSECDQESSTMRRDVMS